MYTRYVIRHFSKKNLKHILFFRLILHSYYSIFDELLKKRNENIRTISFHLII